jgi:hypothetical protein
MAGSLENWVQHISNPLHIYCRLVDLGMDEEFSKRFGIFYEKYFYRYLLRDLRLLWNYSKKRSL